MQHLEFNGLSFGANFLARANSLHYDSDLGVYIHWIRSDIYIYIHYDNRADILHSPGGHEKENVCFLLFLVVGLGITISQ